ncbi:MAG: IS1595 family transposase [Akkermansiaceae bacterium]|nr:IS1595 family transposase [Akkermansiaceae bacterium]
MGKIKLKLPGSRKDPNTAAEVELPIDMPGMSPTLIEGLNRGVRLQARKNVRANSFKRDPQTGKLIPYEEWKAQQLVNKPTESHQSDNVIEFPALAKAASTSPGLANLLAKSLGAGVGGTIGALGGGAGAVHLAKHLGAGDTVTALTGILGRGSVGKLIVIGAKQRNGKVIVKHIDDTSAYNLQGFIGKHVERNSNVFTDEFRSYKGLVGFVHEFVNHKGKQYVNGNVHTNSIESFWSLLKRGYYGVYHYMSPTHLKRYINEFAYRHNTSHVETMDFISDTITKMIGRRLMYCELVS